MKISLLSHPSCEQGLILELAFALALGIFPPGEACPVGHIYIVSRGAALFAGRPFLPGSSWGEADALLTTDRLRFPIPATALNYLFTFSIDGATLRSTMAQGHKYPHAARRLRSKQVHWIVRRGIVRAAEEQLREHQNARFRNERSFHRTSFSVPKQLGETGLSHLVRAAQTAARRQRRWSAEVGKRSNSCGHLNLDRQGSKGMITYTAQLQKQLSSNDVAAAAGELYGARPNPSLAVQLASAAGHEATSLQKVVATVATLQGEMEQLKRAQREDAKANRAMQELLLHEVKRMQRA